MFRLGKWSSKSSSSPRPVLIKLCAALDRKILLVQKRKRQQFRLRGLFLRADVPPEHQLRQGSSKSSSKPNSLPSDPNVTQLQSAESGGSVETLRLCSCGGLTISGDIPRAYTIPVDYSTSLLTGWRCWALSVTFASPLLVAVLLF